MKPPFFELQEMALPPIIQTGSKGYLVSDFTLRLGSGFVEFDYVIALQSENSRRTSLVDRNL